MSSRSFPYVSTYALPEEALCTAPSARPRIPAVPAPEEKRSEAALPDITALTEALTPRISSVIARRARQRRYT